MEMGREVVVGTSAANGAPPPTSLAPGFRFHPTDEELVRYYLRRKVCGKPFRFQAVTEIDVYKSEPWELADYSALKTRDLEWYFFSPVDRKYGNGSRLNRATDKGYWKATGKDRPVRHKNETIGMKKTLVFHSGRAPDGKRTNWVMHEYRLCDTELESAGISQDAFVLCRIFQKSGLGPPNGDRYAPFVEEEWDEDAPLLMPGEDAEDDLATVEEPRLVHYTDIEQDTPPLEFVPPPFEKQNGGPSLPLSCKREEREGEPSPLSLSQAKRGRLDEPNPSRANGSEDSTTSQDPFALIMTKRPSSPAPLLEFPLMQPAGPRENRPPSPPTFDSSNLEKSVPPGYLKFISNLENEILNVSMEKETLKIEVMRAQAMINILQSQLDSFPK